MNDSRYALRPEAGPVPFDSLHRSQRDAMKAIIVALNEAKTLATSTARTEGQQYLVDLDRVSRLFFVSGEPGSGKSSLYLTLRDILSDHKLPEDDRKKYVDKFPFLEHLSGATRWLEQVDLEVAGEKGENLLAAVLVRISDALGSSSKVVSHACQEATTLLEELANDIGIAWDGNLQARASSLDPHSYSQEVMSAQRARLGTNKRLRQALDTLSEKECYGCTGETLFILPIDDFYLKPAASLELLRLLRMISVPRLFFLIMGDIKTMEALFFEKALADWTEVAGPQVFASLDERREREILPRAREMKARYLRKLLPVAQRTTIEVMEWKEALWYMPAVTKPLGSARKLSCLLSDVRICWTGKPNDASRNLLNYLVAPNVPEGETEDGANEFREAYSALQILDATPREVMDFWMCLRELKKSEPSCKDRAPAYLRKVFEFVLFAIEEQDFLTEKEQELLRFAFPSSYKLDLQVTTDNIALKPTVGPKIEVSSSDVSVCKHFVWEIRISDVDDKKSMSLMPLPPRPAAWIILLHDLVWNWRQESIAKNLVCELLKEIRKSRISLTSKEDATPPEDPEKALTSPENPGWAWYSHENEWLHFPLPNLDTFRQLDRFLMVWNAVLPCPDSKKPLNLDTLVRRWVFAAWIAAGPEDRYEKFATDKDEKDRYEKFAADKDEDRKLNAYMSTLLKDDRILEALGW